MAVQRISEYFNIYATNRAYTTWKIVNADADSVTTKSKSAGAVVALNLVGAVAAGQSGKTNYTSTAVPNDKLVRFIICVQFSTEENK
jgi:hypothetical protein